MTFKRVITKQEEQALRLVHHDFAGLARKEAAKTMGISQSRLSYLLGRAKKVVPQFFPILTSDQNRVHWLLTTKGCSRADVAEIVGCPLKRVDNIIKQLRHKGILLHCKRPATQSYQSWMDGQIVEKF